MIEVIKTVALLCQVSVSVSTSTASGNSFEVMTSSAIQRSCQKEYLGCMDKHGGLSDVNLKKCIQGESK